ncbi:hypothetical protein [Bradyrhizobium sp. LMG 9283]|uniref:hypothetical protein n=1 Tax=Bradyrhizobium sp. LMG 9283 TaxID=592064 RepID=UPI00388CF69F
MASELEARWNKALAHAAEVERKIATHDAARPMPAADPNGADDRCTAEEVHRGHPDHEVAADIDDVAPKIVLIVH